MTTDEKFILIRNYDLFAQLTGEEYEELNLVHHFNEARKGEYIYFDSHHLNKLYFLKKGYIRIGYIDEEGNEIIREIIRSGEIFGQFTLEKNNMNGEFARAHKGDVSICAFNIEDFERILKQKPQLAIQFTRQVGQKLRHTEYRLLNLLHKNVRSRLLGFFYQLALQHGYNEPAGSFIIENFLTHDDIARLIGSARQTVTTFISQLHHEGLVIITRQQIQIPDVKKLQKLVIVT